VIVSHREVIDQAKGMLMVIYQLSADAALPTLKWRSQQLNVKLSTVAEKLVVESPKLECPPGDAFTYPSLPPDPHATRDK
jgi:hypothetical protein